MPHTATCPIEPQDEIYIVAEVPCSISFTVNEWRILITTKDRLLDLFVEVLELDVPFAALCLLSVSTIL